jgi:AraC-like DNA-binding protein
VLDRHESWPKPRQAPHLLRLAWKPDPGLGGLYRPGNIDLVIRTAERDPEAASALLDEELGIADPLPVAMHDWPDLLAAALRSGPVGISSWARDHGLSRETVSRGFSRCWGVSPQGFAGELRARQAWVRSVCGNDRLADVAADLGFADQPHMTRAVRALTGVPPAAWRRCVAKREVTL